MKIGKITFDGYNNYGNSLQNYALQEYLKKYADTVDTIWHSPHERLSEFWKWGNKEEIKFLINHDSFRKEVKSGIRAWELARRARGMDFSQRYIDIRYDVNQLKTVADEYDYFVVGSDQVWNPMNKDIDIAFLDFCDSCKRISYAASIGAESIPDNLKARFTEGFSSMHAISVRESKAVEIINDLTGINATLVLDPVFSVDENKWRSISQRPYWLGNQKYLFAYFLSELPDKVVKFANDHGYEIIKCFDRSSIDRYIMSPEEWLYLLGNADFVCTDSFHATAFSIIFDRKFLVFPRKGGEENRQMITRIESILSTFDVSDRLVNVNNEEIASYNHNPDFKKVIERELKKSDDFISKALRKS